jgi:hypothetical protein
MATLEQRLTALENATTKNEHRPMPLSYFYGEPLPVDFYTNKKYIYVRDKPRTIVDFYGRTP